MPRPAGPGRRLKADSYQMNYFPTRPRPISNPSPGSPDKNWPLVAVHIALLRGINADGKNILPMKESAALLECLGLHNVATYLNSGNLVSEGEVADINKLTGDIKAAVGDGYGFTPQLAGMAVMP